MSKTTLNLLLGNTTFTPSFIIYSSLTMLNASRTLHQPSLYPSFTIHLLCSYSAFTLIYFPALRSLRVYSAFTLGLLFDYSLFTLRLLGLLCFHSSFTPCLLFDYSLFTLSLLCTHSPFTPYEHFNYPSFTLILLYVYSYSYLTLW